MTPQRLIALAIVSGSALALAGGAAAQRWLQPQGPSTPAWIACVVALLSPLLASALRGPAETPREPARAADGGFGRQVAFFAVLEGGVVLCAVALVVTSEPWPLLAAAVPLAVMLANLPPAGE